MRLCLSLGSQLSNYLDLDIRDVLSKEPKCPSLHGFDLAC